MTNDSVRHLRLLSEDSKLRSREENASKGNSPPSKLLQLQYEFREKQMKEKCHKSKDMHTSLSLNLQPSKMKSQKLCIAKIKPYCNETDLLAQIHSNTQHGGDSHEQLSKVRMTAEQIEDSNCLTNRGTFANEISSDQNNETLAVTKKYFKNNHITKPHHVKTQFTLHKYNTVFNKSVNLGLCDTAGHKFEELEMPALVNENKYSKQNIVNNDRSFKKQTSHIYSSKNFVNIINLKSNDENVLAKEKMHGKNIVNDEKNKSVLQKVYFKSITKLI